MTQPSAKGREKRRIRYQMMLLELRLLGARPAYIDACARGTPNSDHLRNLAAAITRYRSLI